MNKHQKRKKNKSRGNLQGSTDAEEDVQISSSETAESQSQPLSFDTLNAIKARESRKSLSFSILVA